MKKWLITAALTLLLVFSASCQKTEKHEIKNFNTETYAYVKDSLIYKDSTTRIFKMTSDPYDVEILVVITKDLYRATAFSRYVLEDYRITPEWFQFKLGLTFSREGYPIVMWLPAIPKSYEEIGIANHELTHVLGMVMLGAGVPFTRDTQEAYAYEMSHLSRQFYHGVWED